MRYSVAEAKNNLPKLIDRALAGEDVTITRRGEVVVSLKAEKPAAGTAIDLDSGENPPDQTGQRVPWFWAAAIREMRDEGN